MSAKNWTLCPKCEEGKTKKVEELKRKINDSYGKIPEVKYKAFNQKLKEIEATAINPTLREDYEIGIRNGEFKISYYALCEKCEYSYEYKYSENVNDKENE